MLAFGMSFWKQGSTKTKLEVLKAKAPFLLMGVAASKTFTSLVASSNVGALQTAVTAVTARFLALTRKRRGRYLCIAVFRRLSGHARAPLVETRR